MQDQLSFTDGKDIHSVLKTQVDVRPDAPFLHWAPFTGEHHTYSYKAFYDAVLALAAGLRVRGIEQGDTLLLHANNCPEFLLTWHACAALGAVVVTTNPRSSLDELEYFTGHAKPKAIITQPAFLPLFESIGAQVEWTASTATDSGEAPEHPIGDGILPFATLSADAAGFERELLDPKTPLSVQYTSGTTSRPKGVVWTHANAIWAGQVGTAQKGIRDDDTAIIITPLCHTNAMSWAHLPALWSGGAIALQPKFSASRFWDVALRYGCTWGCVIPFAIHALATKPVPDHAMRFWIVGAANTGPAEALFKLSFVGAWGMTETVTHATYTYPHMTSPPLSMGMPMPQYDFKVVDDTGQLVAPGEVGQLMIRGQRGLGLFLEYLHDPDATAACFDEDGWFDTADRVMRYKEGHLRFSDRSKDMLKVGAENVAASEVEAVISSHDDVMETAVVARPDKMKDEVPVAFVRTTKPSEELRAAIYAICAAKLSDFKRPVAIVFCEDFPRAEVNKVAKGKLRDQAAALTLSE